MLKAEASATDMNSSETKMTLKKKKESVLHIDKERKTLWLQNPPPHLLWGGSCLRLLFINQP